MPARHVRSRSIVVFVVVLAGASCATEPQVQQYRLQGQKLTADTATGRFATAPAETVDRFAATFGVNVIREADGTITHNLSTAVIGPNGRMVSIYDGGEWTPAQIADDLRRALAGQ